MAPHGPAFEDPFHSFYFIGSCQGCGSSSGARTNFGISSVCVVTVRPYRRLQYALSASVSATGIFQQWERAGGFGEVQPPQLEARPRFKCEFKISFHQTHPNFTSRLNCHRISSRCPQIRMQLKFPIYFPQAPSRLKSN